MNWTAADEVKGELKNGRIFTWRPSKGLFISTVRPLRKGTWLRLTATKDGETARTEWFRYLIDEPK